RMTSDPEVWSQPISALLGGLDAQLGFGLPSIGGKDSMSGTFDGEKGQIDVPPTLISFAVDVADGNDVISPEFKAAGNTIVLFGIEKNDKEIPDYPSTRAGFDLIHGYIKNKVILSAYALGAGGLAPALTKCGFGNGFGVAVNDDISAEALVSPGYGCILAEVAPGAEKSLEGNFVVIGKVTDDGRFTYKDTVITQEEALKAWSEPLEKIFPSKATDSKDEVKADVYRADSVVVCGNKVARPRVFIPVFPGTNCEYDTARAFEKAGADVSVKVFKNLTAQDIEDSVAVYEKEIAKAQIVMFPGGFSAGDEPEGSAKFFASVFRNEKLKESLTDLLDNRDGLVLGICNGFQALIKLGLVPYGQIRDQRPDAPTLTYNTIGRHISKMVYTKVMSNKSPWLAGAELGGVYTDPASHGEGRFVAPKECLDELIANGQVATMYVNPMTGCPTMDEEWNVNGSYMAIEGITSPDGRVYGKMAHAERIGEFVAGNIAGNQDMRLFESGVNYFK
ncbi:MAG: phosphoribosylformylglycinamidine synthase subunit PurQ, partial [Eubacterium sp.]|nr:phosphoribosylformylglycinamidine synthase subunit PurQ [Eubacterium sp.]